MATNISLSFSAVLSILAGDVAAGDALVEIGSGWVKATTANLAGVLIPQAIAQRAGSAGQSIPVQEVGIVSGLLPAYATVTYATVSATARVQRTVSPGPTQLVIGLVYPNGDVGLSFPGSYPGAGSSTAVALQSATTVVDVSAATAPTAGQVLTAQSSTTATWETPSGSAAVYWIDASQPPYSMVADSDRNGGGTNNTAKLQAAIDAMSGYGGTIVIPGGDYRLSGSATRPGIAILTDKRIRFQGNGSGQYAYGTTLVCDAGVTGFLTTYELGNASGQDASWHELSIIAAGHTATSQTCSWDGGTRVATIGAAGDFVNGQIVRIRGAAGMLPIPVTMATCGIAIGTNTVRIAGYSRFLVGMYVTVPGAFVARRRVTAVNYLDYTVGVMTNRWVNNTAYAQYTDILPRVNNGFAYRAIAGGTSAVLLANEPDWASVKQLGLTIVDNGVTWQCVAIQSDPVTITVAGAGAAGTVGGDLVLNGAQISVAFDVKGRIVSGGGTTSLTLDTNGGDGDGTTIPTYPFEGSPTTTDLVIEHHDSGVYATATCGIYSCTLGTPNKGFQGAGAIFYGNPDDVGGPTNSDLSRIQDTWCFHNYHAVQLGGTDANRVKLDMVKSVGSRAFSFIDGSGLGTVMDNCHADAGYGYLTANTPGTATSLRDCYAEGGTYSYLGPGCVQVNGSVSAASGGTTYTSGNATGFSLGKASGAGKYSIHELGLDQNVGWAQWISDGNPDHPIDHRKSNTAGDGALGYVVWATTSSTAGKVRYSRVILDHDVASGWVGAEWLIDRIYVGGGLGTGTGNVALVNALSGRRAWSWSYQPPTTGTWAAGDRIWNEMSVDTSTNYWECTVAGTPGTWVARTAAGASAAPGTQGLRLSLTTAVPVTTTDVTAASTLYLTPDESGDISLYNGSSWDLLSTAEVSIALSGLTSGKNYDVFAYNASGTVTLELSAAWGSDTTRTDAISRQNGVYVKTGTPTRRHVGTFRTTSTTTTEDSKSKRFVWNRYNQVPRTMSVVEGTASWSYTTRTWRAANGNAANCFEYVSGDLSTFVEAVVFADMSGAASAASVGIGVDSTTVTSTAQRTAMDSPGGYNLPMTCQYQGWPGLGYHKLTWLETGNGSNASTFLGSTGTADLLAQCGMSGKLAA